MREYEVLDDELYTKITDSENMDNPILFGKGNLLPIFKFEQESIDMIIAKHEEYKELGVIVEAKEGLKLVEKSEPLVKLSFPKGEKGNKSLEALKEWLEIIEEYLDTES